MAKAWKLALTIAAGLAVGAGSAGWSMKRGGLSGVGAGGWYGSAVTGSVDADPWTRARVALTGLLALNKSQASYFTTNVDAAGARLREDCRYQVAGGALPALPLLRIGGRRPCRNPPVSDLRQSRRLVNCEPLKAD